MRSRRAEAAPPRSPRSRRPPGKAWSDVVTATPDGGYRMGNPNAPIKLVEYGSLTCPHCAEFAKESSDELTHQFVDSGRVSFEFRNFIRDTIDMTSAMLVRCAPPEDFFALTHATFANQPAMFDKLKAAGDKAYTDATALPDAKRFVALAQLTGLEDFFASNGLPKAQAASLPRRTPPRRQRSPSRLPMRRRTRASIRPRRSSSTTRSSTRRCGADTKARLEAMGAR